MARPQIIEGTAEEIVTFLRRDAFAGKKMRVIIDADPLELSSEDFSDHLSDSPRAVRDMAQLEQELVKGLASPAREMTGDDWNELKRRAHSRIAGTNL
jgi:hypothetical protein